MLLMASQVSAQTVVTGIVKVTTRAGIPAQPAVVYAQPIDRPVPARPATFTLTQKNKAFAPRVLASAGRIDGRVSEPGRDLPQRVLAVAAGAVRSRAVSRGRVARAAAFTEPATYRVFCNIHPQMTAFIVVAPTPFVTVTDRERRVHARRCRRDATGHGPDRARRAGDARGRGDRRGRDHEPHRAGRVASLVDTPHKNKFGKPYPGRLTT